MNWFESVISEYDEIVGDKHFPVNLDFVMFIENEVTDAFVCRNDVTKKEKVYCIRFHFSSHGICKEWLYLCDEMGKSDFDSDYGRLLDVIRNEP